MKKHKVDPAFMKFGGAVIGTAERLGYSTSGTGGELLIETKLWKEYQQDGSPKAFRKWIEGRLPSVFKSVSKKPDWKGSYPRWAFHEGEPMVFIQQFNVPPNDISEQHVDPGCDLYVFGIRVPVKERPGSCVMQYQVISVNPELKSIR